MSAIDGKRTLAEILKVAGKDVDERRALRFFRATLAIRPGRLQRIACCKLIKLDSMDSTITALPFAAAMLIGMLICLDIGRRVGRRHQARDPQLMSTHSSVDGAVFALYGLLLAFTFSGAPQRLDMRRHLIAQEANAIGTAYLRLDLLSADQQPALRQLFRNYLDSRLEIYRKFRDVDAAKAELAISEQLQREIWIQAITATRSADSHSEVGKLLLPSVNEMIDIANTRTMAARIHPPTIIFALLFVLAMVCSLLSGYGMAASRERSWLHIIAFVMIAVITVFVILEIEYPRIGFHSTKPIRPGVGRFATKYAMNRGQLTCFWRRIRVDALGRNI